MKREPEGYPILTAAQTREMDARAPESGLPLALLMENAGRAVADAAAPFGARRILVAAGAGNNGGDGFVAARFLLGRGARVTVACARPVDQLSGLPRLAAERFVEAGGRVAPLSEADWGAADLIIDALLGVGASGQVREPIASAIVAVNAADCPVLSVDVPSGMDADDAAEPALAVRADATVAVSAYKPAHIHFPAAERCGRVILADIGFRPSLYPPPSSVAVASDFVRESLPKWGRETHKGARGSLLIAAGSRGMAGAAAMSANAAVHTGAGLVYLACPESLVPVYEAKLTEIVLRPAPDGGDGFWSPNALDSVTKALESADALVLGPGLGARPPAAEFVEGLLRRLDKPSIIDADALNIIAAAGLTPPPNCVLTPHPGEMARLMNCSVPEVQADRPAIARAAAEKFHSVVVLKGAHTVIAQPGRVTAVNTVSHSVLATAGSGDLLSGVIGALLAQGAPPYEAAVCGVRLHGTAGVLAASKWGGTLGATDVLRFLSRAREALLTNHEIEVIV